MSDWIVAYRCSRCRAVLGRVDVDVSADGTFEISDVPGKCNNAECQAGFNDLTGHTLGISLYRRSAP
jgi:hypothetical protein